VQFGEDQDLTSKIINNVNFINSLNGYEPHDSHGYETFFQDHPHTTRQVLDPR